MAELVPLLVELIAHDTRSPEGDERPLAARLRDELAKRGPDHVELVENQGRHAYVLARWGTPRVVLNAHIDTVPANAGWTGAPHVAYVEHGKLYGLGAADTKGAIAAILAALDLARPRDLLVLFSGDEEHGGTCMRHFLESGRGAGLERAVVCEPTSCRVGARHRGVISIEAALRGAGGHSSGADHMPAPLADLARAAVAVADWGKAWRDKGPDGFRGMCTNIAGLDGGVAFNVVPDAARFTFSVRPPPGVDAAAVKAELDAIVLAHAPGATLTTPLYNPTFATRALDAFAPLLGSAVARPVDLPFWTEAAVLSEAGVDAVVFGPGDIAQAHAPDEWVPVADLERARDAFVQVIHGCR